MASVNPADVPLPPSRSPSIEQPETEASSPSKAGGGTTTIKAISSESSSRSSKDGAAPQSSSNRSPKDRAASKSSSDRSSKDFLAVAGQVREIRAARRFEMLGMANLLRLQVDIRESEKRLAHPGLDSDERNKIFNELMDDLRYYNRTLLEQRQILSLPKYAVKEVPSRKAASEHFKTFAEKEGFWESEDFVSLDPCFCPPVCSPKGLGWLFHLPTWEGYRKENEQEQDDDLEEGIHFGIPFRLKFYLKWLGKFLLASFFAVLPAASILVLYVIPTPHKRLWAILGESGFLVCALTLWKTKSPEKLDILTYMLGIAAVQVIFVGSVIGS